MASMTTKVPAQKVTAGAVAGALTTIVIWAVRTTSGVDIPGEVAAAITMVLTFTASYFTPPSERDQITADGKALAAAR